MRIWCECPECGHTTGMRFEKQTIDEAHHSTDFITCEKDHGGCGKLFAAEFEVDIHCTIYSLTRKG